MCVVLLMVTSNVVYAAIESKDVLILSFSKTITIEQKTHSYLDDITEGISLVDDLWGKTIQYGEVISVLGDDSVYFVPVFCEKKCIYIIKVTVENNELKSIVYGQDFSGMLNTLLPGEYYFESKDKIIYLVGKNGSYVVENEENLEVNFPVYNKNVKHVGVNPLYSVKYSIIKDCNTRDTLYKELTTLPRVANYGLAGNGSCWLSSALAISRYYGDNTSDMPYDIHNQFYTYYPDDASYNGYHNKTNVYTPHQIYACTGGSIIDGNLAIKMRVSKAGTIQNNPSASMVYSSIYNNTPVYSDWEYTDSSGIIHGHAMVVCGYIFNNSTGSFTYIIMDPNQSSRQYVVTTYGNTNILYGSYTWINYIYNFQNVSN